MAKRALSQKIGARGHKWLLAHVESNPDWLSRDLGEDFGIDMEIELTEPEVRGEVIKVQVKSSNCVTRKNGCVQFNLERKYIEYANSCRYPVIFVVVDVTLGLAWYVWLQEWLLLKRNENDPLSQAQDFWTEWVPETKTIQFGLVDELKRIARWEGETQLVLSLVDAMRSAIATQNVETIDAINKIIIVSAPKLGDIQLNIIISKAISLGNRLSGTLEGQAIADQLFSVVRKLGGRISKETVATIVLREDSYSRTGLIALAILYDEFPQHMISLNLPEFFKDKALRVAYYCALRDHFPGRSDLQIAGGLQMFSRFGLKFVDSDSFLNKYMNRGTSAILDCLEND